MTRLSIIRKMLNLGKTKEEIITTVKKQFPDVKEKKIRDQINSELYRLKKRGAFRMDDLRGNIRVIPSNKYPSKEE